MGEIVLLLDIGNTRLKWARLDGSTMGAQFASVHTNVDRAQVLERLFAENAKPNRVLISNVGGAEIGSYCAAEIGRRWGLQPTFVQATAQAAGVRNAYDDPAKLGVDRWLTVIAAHSMKREAACIVSVGTAMTIDGVDAEGRHLGGVIVPGPALMISSLLRNTSDIASRMAGGDQHSNALFAQHTGGAVRQGCAHALAALVDRAVAEMESIVAAQPLLLVTGGASDSVSPLIKIPHERVPDLVLRGLAVIAEEG